MGMSDRSPRGRGIRLTLATDHIGQRSIPACAGHPQRMVEGRAAFRVYPRVCGASRRGVRQDSSGWGLSPRVRGIHCVRMTHEISQIHHIKERTERQWPHAAIPTAYTTCVASSASGAGTSSVWARAPSPPGASRSVSGSYASREANQRSTSATSMPLRAA